MGTTLIQFDRKVIYASRKSKGIFPTPYGIEKLLRTRSKTCRPLSCRKASKGSRFYDLRPLTRIRNAQW